MDVVKLSLYVLLEHLFLGRGQRYHSDMWLLQMVDDLKQLNHYPWGSIVFKYTFRCLSRVMCKQLATYTRKKLLGKKKMEKYKNKYNLVGFSFVFQVIRDSHY